MITFRQMLHWHIQELFIQTIHLKDVNSQHSFFFAAAVFFLFFFFFQFIHTWVSYKLG